MTPKYPHINIPLVGEDGNAYAILGRVRAIMNRNGLGDKRDEFTAEATSGDYDNLLATVMMWFAVDENLGDDYDEEEWDHDWSDEQHDDEKEWDDDY